MEMWSEDLLLYGNGPLPMYIEPPITKKSREDLVGEYPYTLITGGRSHAFFHTEYRNSPWLREVHMFPTMDINPETAAETGHSTRRLVLDRNLRRPHPPAGEPHQRHQARHHPR